MSEVTLTTTTFELPIGYTDEHGARHTTVVMRKAKNKDPIRVQSDTRIKALLVQRTGKVDQQDPMIAMRTGADMVEIFGVLFTQVIESIGTINKPTKAIMDDLYQEDMTFMIAQYSKFNNSNVENVLGELAGPRIVS